MRTLVALLLFGVLSMGCMSDADRIKEIQWAEAKYTLTQIAVEQLRERRDSLDHERHRDTAAIRAVDENIRAADSSRIALELQLRRLRRD